MDNDLVAGRYRLVRELGRGMREARWHVVREDDRLILAGQDPSPK